MDAVTKNVAAYVKNKGISIAKIARDTGIPYSTLYDSLSNSDRGREIRGKELLVVCDFLGVDPRIFAEE